MNENMDKGQVIINELINLLSKMGDKEKAELLLNSSNELFSTILNPVNVPQYPSVAEYLLANKYSWSFIGTLISGLIQGYCIEVKTKDGKFGYVSPTGLQWFEEGVMYLEGKKRNEGVLSLYKGNGEAFTAIFKRDITGGQSVGKDDVEFITIAEAKERFPNITKGKIRLDEPIQELRLLLEEGNNKESKYQELLQNHSWVFGLIYKKIDRHTKLNEKNIPDFTGVRINGGRDIFEIKPPFAKIFDNEDTFTNKLYEYWNQAKRYLDFVRQRKDYLYSEHGFLFDIPKCYLIMGYNLTDKQKKEFDIKRRNSPIELLTYNDLLAFMENTVKFIKDNKIIAE